MLQQAISVALLAAMTTTIPPAASQGIQGTISGNVRQGPPATRVFVATPYPSSPGDSTAAVTIGNTIRSKLSNNIGGSDWAVVTRAEMNKNLISWGYSADQLFQPESARQMVTAMQARMFVMTTMTKGSDGRFTASVRVTGATDDAGHVLKSTQAAGQSLTDFANKLTDQISVVFKAYPDAKQCSDNLTTAKPKALEGANRALKSIPGYGFPEYCLGLIEQMKDSTGPETVKHFRNAVADDPFSLKAVNQLAIIDQKKKDTTAVVSDFTQMLTIQPSNRLLADQAYKIFKQWGHPEAADSLAAAQMLIDPSSPDWPDLMGNSCAAAAASGNLDPARTKAKFECAYKSFLRVVELDPTRADTDFYPKIVYVAGNRADSMMWAKKWAEKYSSIVDPYKLELSLYMDAGQVDSALGVVKMIGAIDPTDARGVLAVEQAMLKAHRYDDAIKLAPMFPKGGDESSRNLFAGLLVTFADSMTRDSLHRNDSTLAHMGHAIVAFNPPNKGYTDFGHYFIITSYVPGLQAQSAAARTDKSCETLKKYEAFLAAMESDPSMAALSASSNASLTTFATQMTGIISGEKPKMPELEKAFCKPAAKP
jgi:tetratricopeptide (TPR) repeat protein